MVDFHWNPAEPFTLMSVADDSALDKGGGTLQLWRISDLITRPEEEVLVELEPHRRVRSQPHDGSCFAAWCTQLRVHEGGSLPRLVQWGTV